MKGNLKLWKTKLPSKSYIFNMKKYVILSMRFILNIYKGGLSVTDTLLLILCKSDNLYHFDIAKDPEEGIHIDTLENIRASIKNEEILKNLRSGDENNYPNLFVAEVENPSLLGREHAYTDLRIVDTLENIMKGKE